MRRLERKIVAYLSAELLVAIAAILGNGFVAVVYIRDRRLRTPTNLYIFSLAIVNLLTSIVAIPAYLNSQITPHSHDYDNCLYINVSLVTCCTISILHLVAVSFDRYIAVVWRWKPVSHVRGMIHAVALTLLAWILGGIVGCMPLMGWSREAPKQADRAIRCEFLRVMDLSYLLFIFYATVLTPSILLIFFYVSIYYSLRNRVATSHKDSLALVHSAIDTRMSVRSKRSAVQAQNPVEEADVETQMQLRHIAELKRITFGLLLVIIFFHICWYPLHIMNVISYYMPYKVFRKWHFYAPIVLSHASNAINPLIYGFAMPKFKEAFLDALICKDQMDQAVAEKGIRRSQVARQA